MTANTGTTSTDKLQSLYTKLSVGATQNYTFEQAFHAYWTTLSVAGVTFDERMLNWINGVLSASFTDVPQALQAYAVAKGANNWDSLGDLQLP